MKKLSGIIAFILIHLPGISQNSTSFEKAIREGNSEKGFEFVRTAFDLPAIKDPFLHFEEEGISRLSSFCSYRDRKVVATSLIRYNQVKEFWGNYSKEFTGGKWDYHTLYASDSVAWFAANYSIMLIYAHEMGHYMSYRFRAEPNTIYTCEEVLANECLAAFANAFSNNKTLNQHKQLFIRLARQTASLVPDSAKTPFHLPLDKWCADDPMKDFLPYFETDNTRFLRLYGYSQFCIMNELLTNYKSGTWKEFLDNTFYRQYNQRTLSTEFTPLHYRLMESESIKQLPGYSYQHELTTQHGISYYSYYNDDHVRYSFNEKGRVFQVSIPKEETGSLKDTAGEILFNFYNHYLQSLQSANDSFSIHRKFIYLENNHNTRPFLEAAWEDKDLSYYLVNQRTTPDSSLINWSGEGVTDSLFFHRVRQSGEDILYSIYPLPPSVTSDTNAISSQVLLSGSNLSVPLLITNRLLNTGLQEIKIFITDTSTNEAGSLLWTGRYKVPGFLYMQCPSVFIDKNTQQVTLAFFNSFTEKIRLISISEKGTKGYELYGQRLNNAYGPQLQVLALQLSGPDKMYVLAKTRKPGNKEKTTVKKLLIQWH